MTEPFEYLTTEDLAYLGDYSLVDPLPTRDIGLLGAAAARPQTTVLGADATRTCGRRPPRSCSPMKIHALADGNKRLGWLATAVFLDLNGVDPVRTTNDDVYDLL